MANRSSQSVGLLLFDGFSNMVLASALEPLRALGNVAGKGAFSWRLATLDGGPVVSSSGLRLQVDGPIDSLCGVDLLIVICGFEVRRYDMARGRAALRRTARTAGVVAGYDTGSWLLAGAGLLDGRRATIHWQVLEEFQETFVNIDAVAERYVIDGNRMTAGSASGVMDLTLEIIRRATTHAEAFDAANMFRHRIETPNPFDLDANVIPRTRRSPVLIQAVEIMRRAIERPLRLDDVAIRASISRRSLERLFQVELGVAAGTYYRSVRLSHARGLVRESHLSAAEIAARSGFSSSTTLSRAYRAHFGTTVRDDRRGFGLRAPRQGGA
ncbi:MAG: GlxA family transcriptional regulator [Rhodospirillaceae bacterium]|nr:GlxA family transcriptional regulator [Rhodospirillaceae bacterium]